MGKKEMTVSKFVILVIALAIIMSMVPISTAKNNDAFISPSKTVETLKEDDIPAIIDGEEVFRNNYIGRVKKEENDLCTLVFEKADGSHVMRVFGHPVKYIDDNGKIKDTSLEITQNGDGSFEATSHMIKMSFGNCLQDGLELRYNSVDISITALEWDNSVNTEGCLADKGTITYRADYSTTYSYALTYLGIKESIIVDRYTGQTEYKFLLRTNGLHPIQIDESVYLADLDGMIKASIGDIVIYTADHLNNTLGKLRFETAEENNCYIFTIEIGQDYLKSSKTKYPIVIDPTIEINYSNNGVGEIEDVTINSLQGSYGGSGSLYVGKRETYGVSRVLMRFPNLDLSGIDSAEKITSASVEIRDILCEQESMTVNCYVFTGNTWSENTADWTSVSPNSYTALQSYNVISHNNGSALSPSYRYSFDITEAVKGWKSGTYNQSKGLIFKANSSVESGTININKTFASYNRGSNQPSLSIAYNSGFGNAMAVGLNTSYSVNITNAGEMNYFEYTPSATGFYTFESTMITNGDPVGYLYNNSFNQLEYNDDGGSGQNFKLAYHLTSGVKYYFVAGCYNNGTGAYSVRITSGAVPSSLNNVNTCLQGQYNNVLLDYSHKVTVFRIIPTATCEYLFFSNNSSGDPLLLLYDSSLSLIESDDDSAGNKCFRLVSGLTQGQTYYLVSRHYGSYSGSYAMHVLPESTIETDEVHLKNLENEYYIDIDGPGAQEWVHQWSFHNALQERWKLHKGVDGDYTIQSLYGNHFYVGISSMLEGVNCIKLYSEVAANTKWKIFEYSTGSMILEPQAATGLLLYSLKRYY